MRDKHAGLTLYARWYAIEAQSYRGYVWQIATTQNNIIGEFVAIHNSWTGREEAGRAPAELPKVERPMTTVRKP